MDINFTLAAHKMHEQGLLKQLHFLSTYYIGT